MTKDDIIRMAREAGMSTLEAGDPREVFVQRFAAMVAAAEREACARVCEGYSTDKWSLYKGRPPYTGKEQDRADPHVQGLSCGADDCVDAIRARGQA